MQLLRLLIIVCHCFAMGSAVLFAQQQVEQQAQQESAWTESDIELIERLMESLGEEIDPTEWLEMWHEYRRKPRALQQISERELQELGFLNGLQIQEFLTYRKQYGPFQNILELQVIPSWDLQTIQFLLPFVRVDMPTQTFSDLKSTFKQARQDLMLRYGRALQTPQGYQITDPTRARYLGDINRYLVRYRLSFSDDIRVAINMKKDAGENFFGRYQPEGFDFYSGSIYLKKWKNIGPLVLGDYILQLGQGLLTWNGLSFGKGASVQQVAKLGVGLKPYTSTLEYNFFRGFAGTYTHKHLAFTPFISYQYMDGNIQLTDSGRYVTSFPQTGYHRTPTELQNKNTVASFMYGLNTVFRRGNFQVGSTFLRSYFDAYKLPPNTLRNYYDFEGQALANASLYSQFNWKNNYLFGEYALSDNTGQAYILGLLRGVSKQASIAMVYRNYSKEYIHHWGYGMGETSRTKNEEGMYLGFVLQRPRHFDWNTYVDIFRFPWASYLADLPAEGMDILSQFNWIRYKKSRVTLRVRYRYRMENHLSTGTEGNFLVPIDRWQLRLAYQLQVDNSWTFATRAEGISYQKIPQDQELGWMIFQDINRKKANYSIQMRVAYFSTDGYDSRIYAYERDILYASSFPSYANRGFRYYMNLQYRIMSGLSCWLRYASYMYLQTDSLGSGLDLIAGNRRSELKLQVRYQF